MPSMSLPDNSSRLSPIFEPQFCAMNWRIVQIGQFACLPQPGSPFETDLEAHLAQFENQVCFGGYLEKRNIYRDSAGFMDAEPRDIHLGIDIWLPAGTAVLAPLDGFVHSFANNPAYKDYGPTLILQHEVQGRAFHTLYGHLSLADLPQWKKGARVAAGGLIGHIGGRDENGGWPSHLHFQQILDMQGLEGDYPGVCAASQLDAYRNNCPDPRWMLGK